MHGLALGVAVAGGRGDVVPRGLGSGLRRAGRGDDDGVGDHGGPGLGGRLVGGLLGGGDADFGDGLSVGAGAGACAGTGFRLGQAGRGLLGLRRPGLAAGRRSVRGGLGLGCLLRFGDGGLLGLRYADGGVRGGQGVGGCVGGDGLLGGDLRGDRRDVGGTRRGGVGCAGLCGVGCAGLCGLGLGTGNRDFLGVGSGGDGLRSGLGDGLCELRDGRVRGRGAPGLRSGVSNSVGSAGLRGRNLSTGDCRLRSGSSRVDGLRSSVNNSTGNGLCELRGAGSEVHRLTGLQRGVSNGVSFTGLRGRNLSTGDCRLRSGLSDCFCELRGSGTGIHRLPGLQGLSLGTGNRGLRGSGVDGLRSSLGGADAGIRRLTGLQRGVSNGVSSTGLRGLGLSTGDRSLRGDGSGVDRLRSGLGNRFRELRGGSTGVRRLSGLRRSVSSGIYRTGLRGLGLDTGNHGLRGGGSGSGVDGLRSSLGDAGAGIRRLHSLGLSTRDRGLDGGGSDVARLSGLRSGLGSDAISLLGLRGCVRGTGGDVRGLTVLRRSGGSGGDVYGLSGLRGGGRGDGGGIGGLPGLRSTVGGSDVYGLPGLRGGGSRIGARSRVRNLLSRGGGLGHDGLVRLRSSHGVRGLRGRGIGSGGGGHGVYDLSGLRSSLGAGVGTGNDGLRSCGRESRNRLGHRGGVADKPKLGLGGGDRDRGLRGSGRCVSSDAGGDVLCLLGGGRLPVLQGGNRSTSHGISRGSLRRRSISRRGGWNAHRWLVSGRTRRYGDAAARGRATDARTDARASA
ncbi:hypothetical protein [Streptosporangium nondiastaticum]|uniref:hypothetical protein n=1 Tax=Streptosporangium nondiastaticum TaxID=35764 RepID=UPI001CB93646|nr:hypothetical protein [Streptosporangium nondiastaticum]